MARSSPRRRPADLAPPAAGDAGPGAGAPSVPSLASAIVPRVWQGVGYRPLPDVVAARPLFDYAALSWPPPERAALAWGAFTGAGAAERLIGAAVAERAERAALLHGPVVVEGDDRLEIAAQLAAAALDHARALQIDTVFARPQGLDRVWVRFGFIPVPEGTLPPAFGERRGAGLYAWRGGTALWTLREPGREAL